MSIDRLMGGGKERTVEQVPTASSDDCCTSDHYGTYCLSVESAGDPMGLVR